MIDPPSLAYISSKVCSQPSVYVNCYKPQQVHLYPQWQSDRYETTLPWPCFMSVSGLEWWVLQRKCTLHKQLTWLLILEYHIANTYLLFWEPLIQHLRRHTQQEPPLTARTMYLSIGRGSPSSKLGCGKFSCVSKHPLVMCSYCGLAYWSWILQS